VIVELAAKPLPVTVTVLPTEPLEGVRVIEGSTVNAVLADRDSAVTVTVWAPAGSAGTVKEVPLNAPLLLVDVVPDKVTVVPSKVAVNVWLAGKLDPDTVATVPTGPWAFDGLVMLIDGVLIVYVALALFVEASVTVTTLAPRGPFGTENVTPVKLPVASVDGVPPKLTPVPANVAVIDFDGAKPLPEMLSLVFATPLEGVNVIDGTTVKDVLAECVSAVTVSVWAPAGSAGTVKEAPLNAPLLLVDVTTDKVTVEPAKVAVNVWLAGKFVPDTVTAVPTGPRAVDGVVMLIDGVLMV
jgi:hypothetical protein